LTEVGFCMEVFWKDGRLDVVVEYIIDLGGDTVRVACSRDNWITHVGLLGDIRFTGGFARVILS